MDDADRAQTYEEAAREAALARLRQERAVRRYRHGDGVHCAQCSAEIEPQRTGWSDHCASCARDEERWQRR
jgi:RNA polymerase-binding transcription factor DksA